MNTSQERSSVHDVLDNCEQGDAKVSYRKKVKRKKHKGKSDILEKSEKYQGEHMLSSNDISKMMDLESNQVKIELSSPEQRGEKKKRNCDVLDKNGKHQNFNQEAVAVQAKSDPCPLPSNGFIKTGSDKVDAQLCSSYKKKGKRKKQKNNGDKNQDLPAEVEAVQPNRDMHLQSPAMNHGQEVVGVQSNVESVDLGLVRDSLISGKQGGSLANENMLVVQPNVDPCLPSSDDHAKKRGAENDIANVELSSTISRTTKRKKRKRVKNNQDLEEIAVNLPNVDKCIQSPASKFTKLEDEIGNHGVEAHGVQSVLEAEQIGSLQNQNSLEVQDVKPYRDMCLPSSNGSINKMETESDWANEEIISLKERKVKRKKKKQKMDNTTLDKSDKAKDTLEEVVTVEPRDVQSPASECSKPKDPVGNSGLEAAGIQTTTEVSVLGTADAVISSLSKRKGKRKKQKSGNDILDKSYKDQMERVVIVQPKGDPCLLFSINQCVELEDTVRSYDREAVSVQPVSEVVDLGSRMDNSVMMGNQMCLLNNEITSEVDTEQPNEDQCPQSSNNFNKKMDTESNQVNEQSNSSNKRWENRKKQKRGSNLLDKNDNDQELVEQVVIVQPKSDLLLNSPLDKCSELEDNGFAAISVQSASVIGELGSTDSLRLGKQIRSLKNENTSEVKAVQPKRDQCPQFSNDFNSKVDAENDLVTAELSSSKKKRKKRKKQRRQNDVLDKSDKDHPEEVVIVQPKGNLVLQSPTNKCLELEDAVNDCGQDALSVQSASQVLELGPRMDNALMLKEVSSLPNENTPEVEPVQPARDMCPPSSTKFEKKMNAESNQVNVESSSSNKRKRKRKKQKMGDSVLGKCEKDHDLVQEVVVRDDSLMLVKQSGPLKNDNTLDVEAVQPNRDLCPLSSNNSIKKADQVNADLSLPNKRRRKRKKQKKGNDVPNKSDKDQDLPEEVHGIILDMASSPKKLLILDINGLLCEIVSHGGNLAYKPDTTISRKAVFKRPYCDDFLRFCFERFNVAVWSSRTKANLNSAIKFLMRDYMHKLVFCWDQSHCTRTKFYTLENNKKPLVLKELKKVWEKIDPKLPWERGDFNESNTLLVDDSPYKALRNPAYTAIFPHPYQHADAEDASLGPGGDLRVYLEGVAKADSTQKYVEENPFGQETITDKNQHWHFYSKILQIN